MAMANVWFLTLVTFLALDAVWLSLTGSGGNLEVGRCVWHHQATVTATVDPRQEPGSVPL
jgi:hypothetical protein